MGVRISSAHFLARATRLAPDVTERYSVIAIGRRDDRRAGDFSHIFVLYLNLCAGRRRWPFHAEAGEFAMDVPARANALHDLLAHIAALAEVKRAVLLGLLRKIALADVL